MLYFEPQALAADDNHFQPIMNKHHIILLLLSCLFCNTSLALSTDRDQPADIEADDIEFNFKKGTRKYLGNVLAVQGTLKIKADKLTAKYKGSELQQAKAWGSLARFKQRPDDKPYDVEGRAKEIIVNQVKNTMTLKGSASIKQGPDTVHGDIIVYNMATDTLNVQGNAKVGANKKPAAKAAPSSAAQQARKLEDPFKADDAANNAGTDDETAAPAPIIQSGGRSRLIIQPE